MPVPLEAKGGALGCTYAWLRPNPHTGLTELEGRTPCVRRLLRRRSCVASPPRSCSCLAAGRERSRRSQFRTPGRAAARSAEQTAASPFELQRRELLELAMFLAPVHRAIQSLLELRRKRLKLRARPRAASSARQVLVGDLLESRHLEVHPIWPAFEVPTPE